MRNYKKILTALAAVMIAATLGACQKAPEVISEKLVDYAIDGIGNIKVRMDANDYFHEINRQIPDDPNQPVTKWVRRCAIKDYLIFHDYYRKQSLASLASANIETCKKELKVLQQALSNVAQ